MRTLSIAIALWAVLASTAGAGAFGLGVYAKVPVTTIGALPTCNAASEGSIYGVTDALTPVALATVVAGGAVHIGVYCNGTAWIVI